MLDEVKTILNLLLLIFVAAAFWVVLLTIKIAQ